VSRVASGGAVAGVALALAFAALCARLGVWQWQRGVSREADAARFERGGALEVALGASATADLPLYQHVSVAGRLDGAHQFLLDNRSVRGNAGYEVLTPLARGAAPELLIDRGWVPFTRARTILPDVGLARDAPVTLSGRLANLPSPGLALGRAAPDATGPWPRITSFPDIAQLAAALGTPLEPRILLLDRAAPLGFVRDWRPPGLPAARHFAYAVQWWLFATLALGAALVLGRRAARTLRTAVAS
jgi:surfeit locus 1 family protein